MSDQARRCVLLFSRASRAEGTSKGMPYAAPLFALARHRVAAAVAGLPGVRLVLVGDGPAPAGAEVVPQRGRTFGERLANAFRDARSLGYSEVVAVPTDVPTLDAPALARALAAVSGGRVVLGPSPDGGVYLIGLPSGEELLEGVRWCTPRVLEDLRASFLARGHEPALLDSLADVDRPSDLRLLFARAASDPILAALLRSLAPAAAPPGAGAHRALRTEVSQSRHGRAPPSLLAA